MAINSTLNNHTSFIDLIGIEDMCNYDSLDWPHYLYKSGVGLAEVSDVDIPLSQSLRIKTRVSKNTVDRLEHCPRL